MNVKIGASLGYVSGLRAPAVRNLLAFIRDKGITTVRITEIFLKGFDTDVARTADLIRWLIKDIGFEEVLIGLHGVPHSWLWKYDLSGLDAKQLKATSWCNRFAPRDTIEYLALISSLRQHLINAGVWDSVLVEFGHEPNSDKFYWGSISSFKGLAYSLSPIAMLPMPYIGDFTSSLIRDASPPYRKEWMDWIEGSLPGDRFSHSFYWTDASGTFDPANNSYPKRQFSDIIVSEYNTATSLKPGSPAEQRFNSPLWVYDFFRFLKFMKDKPVSRIYIHTLTDFLKAGEEGNMGLWYRTGQPKEAAKQFLKIWDVNVGCAGMVRGFEVLEDRITTNFGKSIIFDTNGEWEIV